MDGWSRVVLAAGWILAAAGGGHAAALPFFDDFSTDQGWTLGTEWARGPATTSSGHNYGFADPGADYTPTADNYLMGAVIGGNVSTGAHAAYYASSPTISASGVSALRLSFRRWLNSDYSPWMVNYVDVSSGTSWVNIWTSGTSPGVTDSSWVQQAFNVSAQANATFRVRMGHSGNGGAYTVSGWNVDDVLIEQMWQARAAAVPDPALQDQWVSFRLTVTNTGSFNLTGVTPAIQVTTGGPLLAYRSGPSPAGPLTLAPGAATTFVWTYSVSGLGTAGFTATATGTDAATGTAVAVWSSSTLLLASAGLAEAVDNLVLSWTTGGAAPWYGQTAVSQVGGDAAQSGPVGDGATTYLETAVTGPGAVSFLWMTDSEPGGDFLALALDGVELPGKISGATGWLPGSVVIPPGVHVLRWVYATDAAGTAGADAGWVDGVVFTPAAAATIALAQTPSVGATVSAGGAITYRIDITNTGSETITDLVLVDTVSAFVEVMAMDQPAGFSPPAVTAAAGGGTLYAWSAGGLSIPPGLTFSFTLGGRATWDCANPSVPNQAAAILTTPSAVAAAVSNPVTFSYVPAVTSLTATMLQTPLAGSTVSIGATVQYLIVLRNTGSATVTSLVLTDTLPASLVGLVTFESAAFGPPVVTQAAGGTLFIWSAPAASLPPGNQLTITVTGAVGISCGTFSNPCLAAFASNCSAGTAVSNTTAFTVVPPPPGLAVATSHVPAVPVNGGALTYSLVVTNTGAATLTSLVITDTLPATVTFLGQSNSAGLAWSGATAGVMAWNGPVLLVPGASVTVTIDGMAGCGAGAVSNRGWARGMADCASIQAWSALDTYTPSAGTVSISVTAWHAPSEPVIGGPLFWTVIVTNTGSALIRSLTIVDTLPGGVSFTGQSNTAGLAWNGATTGAVGWSGALALAPGASVTAVITSQVQCAGGISVHRGWALASNPCASTQASSIPASLFPSAPVMSLSVSTRPEPVDPLPGGPLTWRIIATNVGTATATTLTITGTLPPGVTMTAQDNSAGLVWNGATTGAIGWTGPVSLGPGASVTATIDGTTAACFAGTMEMSGWAWGTNGCLAAQTFGAPASVVLSPPVPGIAATLAQAPADPSAGQALTYTIVIVNTGEATITTLTLTDTVAAAVTAVATAQPPGFPPPAVTTAGAAGVRYLWTASGLSFAPGTGFTFTITGVLQALVGAGNSAWISVKAAPCSVPLTVQTNAVGTRTTPVPAPSAGSALAARIRPGTVIIAPNVSYLSEPGSGVVVYLKGTAGGTASVRVFDESGELAATATVQLDATGFGLCPADKTESGRRLGPGMYWVLADGGGVRDRKRFIVNSAR